MGLYSLLIPPLPLSFFTFCSLGTISDFVFYIVIYCVYCTRKDNFELQVSVNCIPRQYWAKCAWQKAMLSYKCLSKKGETELQLSEKEKEKEVSEWENT